MYTNDSGSNPRPEWDPHAPLFTMVAQVVMFVVIATVNVLTLVVMAKTPRLRTIPNTYIASLAVSDLLVSVNQLVAIPWTYPKYHGYFETHESLCLFFKCLLHINELTSLFTIVLIGVDRFLYIKLPFWYLRVVTKNKVKVAIVAVWVFCFATSLPIRLIPAESKYLGCNAYALLCNTTQFLVHVKVAIVAVWVFCFATSLPIRLIPAESKYLGCDAYALLYDSETAGYVHGVLFLVICLTLFVSYGIVIRTAVIQARAIQATQRHNINTVTAAINGEASPSPTSVPPDAQQPPRRRRSQESLEARLSLKIVQKMLGVFLVLFVCWSPYVLIGLVGPTNVSQQIVLLTGFLAAFNSAANFGVYALADREFRTATVRVLCCRKRASESADRSNSRTLSERLQLTQ